MSKKRINENGGDPSEKKSKVEPQDTCIAIAVARRQPYIDRMMTLAEITGVFLKHDRIDIVREISEIFIRNPTADHMVVVYLQYVNLNLNVFFPKTLPIKDRICITISSSETARAIVTDLNAILKRRNLVFAATPRYEQIPLSDPK